MKHILSFLLLCCSHLALGQGKWDANWVFGHNAGIYFGDTGIVVFQTLTNSSEANASVSDSQGHLLFYLSASPNSSVLRILDKNNNPILNGDSIKTLDTYTNGASIIPSGYENNKWFIFHLVGNSFNNQYLSFTDVELQNDSLRVVNKNIQMLPHKVEERLALVRHANGKDWWLLVHQSYSDTSTLQSNRFYRFFIRNDSILGPYFQDIGLLHQTQYSYTGEMTFSSDGSMLASTTFNQNGVELFHFDRCTGELSNFQYLSLGTNRDVYSCEFSGDNTKLYAITTNDGDSKINSLVQYRLDTSMISLSRKVLFIDSSDQYRFGQLQIAPNNKIYLSSSNKQYPYGVGYYTQVNNNLSVINDPDSIGLTCDFQLFSLNLGDSSRTYLGLPNMPNYNLGPISVYAANAGRDTVLCASNNTGAVLGVPALPNTAYHWQASPTLSDTNIAQPLATPDTDTYYILTIVDTSQTGTSCDTRTDTVFVKIDPCDGIAETDPSPISVYPNPTNGQLMIECQTTDVKSPMAFRLYNLLGQTVFELQLSEAKTSIDISHLPKGIYLYKIRQQVRKVVVE